MCLYLTDADGLQTSKLAADRKIPDIFIGGKGIPSYARSLEDEVRPSFMAWFPVPFAVIDTYGYIVDCNDLFSQLFDHPDKDALHNVSIPELAANNSREKIEKILSASEPNSGSATKNNSPLKDELIWFNKRNNLTFPATVYVGSLMNKTGKGTARAVVVIDESSGHDRVIKFEREREDYKKREQFKNEFVAIASHELRTPIQPILGFALLANRGIMPQEKAWEGVLTEARRLQQLANDILDVSRIESGGLDYHFQPIRINEVIKNTVESLTTDLKKNVSVTVSILEGSDELEIEADKTRITQAISNVVGNAIKFTEAGEIRVQSRVFKDANRFELRIIDSGIGISDKIMPRLFGRFVTNNHGDAKSHGTGLGLYITKAIVDAHLGRISARNNETSGATFVIELPISRTLSMASKS